MDTTKRNPEEAARRKQARQSQPEEGQKQQKRPQMDSERTKAAGKPRPAGEKKPQEQPRRRGDVPQKKAAPQQKAPSRGGEPQQKASSRPEAAQKKASATAVKEAPRRSAPQKKQELPKRKPEGERRQRTSPLEDPTDVPNRKRAYGNSKPKQRSKLSVMTHAIRETAKESSEKRRTKREMKGRNPAHKAQQNTPAVIYTQPAAFNRNRLLIQLLTVTAVVVAFVMGISVFFKVDTITVAGAQVYTVSAVEEASGINKGDNLLTFSRARAGALIKANLPYVKNVSFGIKLPGTVNIIVEEDDVVYAIKDQVGQWWLINSEGRVVEQGNDRTAANYTQIQGVTIDHPLSGQIAVATEMNPIAQEPDATEEAPAPEETASPMTVSGALRLTTALHILRALEDNDIVGQAASVNVTQTESITLWYGTRYQVNLGNTANLDYKIACMVDVIGELAEYQSGVLDISFTIWPNQVGYTPFA